MRVQAAQHEAAAVEECQQRERSLPDRPIDAQPQVAARARDAAFGHRADSGGRRHEADAPLVLGARLGQPTACWSPARRFPCRAAPGSVDRRAFATDPWHHRGGCHGEMRDRSGERREPMERRAHLVPHRRIQRRGQCRLIVEHHLVALHMRDARPRQAAAPVYTGVDLDLPDAGEARHDRRMVGDVVGQPGRQVLGRAFIGDEIGAGLFARRRAECRIRHRITPHQHRLLRGAVRPQRIEPLQVAIGRQRRFQRRDVIEVELQRQAAAAGRRPDTDRWCSTVCRSSPCCSPGVAAITSDSHAMLRRRMAEQREPADRHRRNSPATAAGA